MRKCKINSISKFEIIASSIVSPRAHQMVVSNWSIVFGLSAYTIHFKYPLKSIPTGSNYMI